MEIKITETPPVERKLRVELDMTEQQAKELFALVLMVAVSSATEEWTYEMYKALGDKIGFIGSVDADWDDHDHLIRFSR